VPSPRAAAFLRRLSLTADAAAAATDAGAEDVEAALTRLDFFSPPDAAILAAASAAARLALSLPCSDAAAPSDGAGANDDAGADAADVGSGAVEAESQSSDESGGDDGDDDDDGSGGAGDTPLHVALAGGLTSAAAIATVRELLLAGANVHLTPVGAAAASARASASAPPVAPVAPGATLAPAWALATTGHVGGIATFLELVLALRGARAARACAEDALEALAMPLLRVSPPHQRAAAELCFSHGARVDMRPRSALFDALLAAADDRDSVTRAPDGGAPKWYLDDVRGRMSAQWWLDSAERARAEDDAVLAAATAAEAAATTKAVADAPAANAAATDSDAAAVVAALMASLDAADAVREYAGAATGWRRRRSLFPLLFASGQSVLVRVFAGHGADSNGFGGVAPTPLSFLCSGPPPTGDGYTGCGAGARAGAGVGGDDEHTRSLHHHHRLALVALELGADASVRFSALDPRTPLAAAAAAGNVPLCRALTRAGAPLYARVTVVAASAAVGSAAGSAQALSQAPVPVHPILSCFIAPVEMLPVRRASAPAASTGAEAITANLLHFFALAPPPAFATPARAQAARAWVGDVCAAINAHARASRRGHRRSAAAAAAAAADAAAAPSDPRDAGGAATSPATLARRAAGGADSVVVDILTEAGAAPRLGWWPWALAQLRSVITI
jgi:hypothetical protein